MIFKFMRQSKLFEMVTFMWISICESMAKFLGIQLARWMFMFMFFWNLGFHHLPTFCYLAMCQKIAKFKVCQSPSPRHPQVLVYAIVFSNALVSSVPQVSLDSHFSMDVKLSKRADVSMEEPSSINLESSMDQS